MIAISGSARKAETKVFNALISNTETSMTSLETLYDSSPVSKLMKRFFVVLKTRIES